MPIPVAGLIAAGASLVGSGAQVYAQGKTNKKTRQWNEMMYGRQRQDAIDDWNRQNEYNSPEATMRRLKEAGLNPNLVYGDGATTVAQSVRSTESKAWNPQAPDYGNVSKAALEGLGAYQDFTLQQEQVKNMVAQRENMQLDSILKSIEVSSNQIKNAKGSLELSQARDLYDTTVQTAKEQLHNLQVSTDVKINEEARNAALHAPNLATAIQRVAALQAGINISAQQLENLKKSGVLQQLEINMRKLGLSYNDGVILRAIAQFSNGKSLPEVVKDIWNKVNSLMSAGKRGLKDVVETKEN